MLNASIFNQLNTILCIGAHADDIEIGCGGTILTLLRAKSDLKIFWVVFSAEGPRANEAKQSAEAFLQGSASSQIVVKDFRTSFFPYQGEPIKDYFEELKRLVQPDLIFTHFRDDRHQDHRVLSDFTWNTFRNHLILEYEIPKFDGDLSQPNTFVPLEDEICQVKVALLQRYFRTQADKHWFTDDTFLALMRLRGIECASRYAEAFFGRKIILATGPVTDSGTSSLRDTVRFRHREEQEEQFHFHSDGNVNDSALRAAIHGQAQSVQSNTHMGLKSGQCSKAERER